jgi:cyclophilin family peptidyl-prolyl cis-trans isomerase
MFKRIMMVFAVLCLAAGIASAAEVKKNPVVEMDTSLGKVKIELFEKEAPISVKNFLDYANSGFFNDTIFHRVIPGFMIQGGGLTSKLVPKGGEKTPIKNEAGNGLKNIRGSLAMARSGVPDSATAQFFINVNNNSFLDQRDTTVSGYGYAVFGKVVEGMDVVDKIVTTPQERKNSVFENVPKVPVVIKSVKVLK